MICITVTLLFNVWLCLALANLIWASGKCFLSKSTLRKGYFIEAIEISLWQAFSFLVLYMYIHWKLL